MSIAPLAPAAVAAPLRGQRLGFAFRARFLLFWALGLAWLIPAFWDTTFLYAVALWDAVLLVAWAFDLARLPRPALLEVERCWNSPLFLGIGGKVSLQLRNTGRTDIECFLIDQIPPALRPSPIDLRIVVHAGSEAGADYDTMPAQRGDALAGTVYARYGSRLRLAERWAAADLHQQVRVYPNFESAKGNTIYLTRSRQIELEKRLLPRRGQGREFEGLREYREGDEFRDICWTATARRAKLVTRIHQVERSQPVWIVLDTGRLMRIRSGFYSKLDYCVDAALGLAGLAMYSGDRAGLLAYGRRVKQQLAPRTGSGQLRNFVELLAQVQAEAAEANHVRAASALLSLQRRRALIVWLTDLAETAMMPEVIEAAGQTLSRHVLLFIIMGDAALGLAASSRAENVEQMYRGAAAQELVYRRELLLGKLRDRGALALEVAPGRLSPMLLDQYLQIKERNLV